MIESTYKKAIKFDQENNVLTVCPYMTIKDAIKYMQMSDSQIRLYIKKGELKAYKIGKLLRLHIFDIDKFMDRNEYVPGA